MKTLMMTMSAALLAAGTAFADPMEWDADADGAINADEFSEGFGAGVFDDYDADADGMLTRDEYTAGVFGTYDADSDGQWTQTEARVWEDEELTSGREKDGGN